MRLLTRSVASICTGFVGSVALNFAALEYIWNTRAYQGRFATAFSAGSFLAPNGFEGQTATVPLNVMAFAVVIGVACFYVLLTRKG
jgi:hypothetical protein